jgi:hypothetical protein
MKEFNGETKLNWIIFGLEGSSNWQMAEPWDWATRVNKIKRR